MDAMITRMCNQGIGRLGYSRVLVEVNAKKGLEDHIDVMYKCKENGEQKDKPREQVQEKIKDDEGFINVEIRKKNKQEDANAAINLNKNDNHENYKTPIKSQKKLWNVDDNVIKDVRSTANKFSVLQDIEEESLSLKLSKQEKEEVGKYVMTKL
ncbi:hypothetical protein Tco_0667042 [Tanacetum coccineum]